MGDTSQSCIGSPTESPDWRCNATIGRYRLLRRLAVGGMAELHLAATRGFGGFSKHVVLKRVRPDLAHRPDMRAMLLDEARLIARMQHRAVVDVLELSEHDGEPYYVMRYVPGADLRAVLTAMRRRGWVMPLASAVHIAIEVAAGLHHAHELCDARGRSLGVVHRDVSTANVQVGRSGEVVVLDFGVARSIEQSAHTAAGRTKGNAAYMSPEQCLGTLIDRRADVFALGAVLFEMVTGLRLFVAADPMDIMRKILSEPIPTASWWRPEIPAELDAIISTALQRDPDGRFATTDAMAVALEHVCRQQRWCDGPSYIARAMAELFDAPDELGREPADPGHRTEAMAATEPQGATAPAPVARSCTEHDQTTEGLTSGRRRTRPYGATTDPGPAA